MGNAAPIVGPYMFRNVDGNKTVNLMVPSGATGYDDAWKTAFKGVGNSENSVTGTVNEFISLVIQYY
jgi:hypothetical protein